MLSVVLQSGIRPVFTIILCRHDAGRAEEDIVAVLHLDRLAAPCEYLDIAQAQDRQDRVYLLQAQEQADRARSASAFVGPLCEHLQRWIDTADEMMYDRWAIGQELYKLWWAFEHIKKHTQHIFTVDFGACQIP